MSAKRDVSASLVLDRGRVTLAHRAVVTALALTLLTGAFRSARAAGDVGSADSRVGVVAAAVCGFALKMSIPAPVPWAGVAAAACLLAFLDAATSPDNP